MDVLLNAIKEDGGAKKKGARTGAAAAAAAGAGVEVRGRGRAGCCEHLLGRNVVRVEVGLGGWFGVVHGSESDVTDVTFAFCLCAASSTGPPFPPF